MRERKEKSDRRVPLLLRIGSMFSGTGGFELAGALNGVEPVWCSEIEPYPIAVTRSRFPNMKHYGDVSKVNGAEVEPVDIITFGSPCQDLSIAGKREGIEDGARSSLFFQAVRIIKEMREETNGAYPRFAVWENVPGAFSSNKGNDFRLVLEALASVSDPEVSIPMPEKWQRAGEIVGNGWSIAWRTLDAQFWGVPQRRKRIYLVADFGSERAGEVLFKPDSLLGYPAQSQGAGQGTATDAAGSVRGSCGAFCAGASPLARSIGYDELVSPTLKSANAGLSMHAVVYSRQRSDELIENTVASCQSARQYKDATDLVVNRKHRKYIVRRLTPTECARLQGFPDAWGGLAPYDGDDAFWQGVYKTACEIKGSKYTPKKDLRKWYNGLHADSAEYKMWGNGIALPCAEYVISSITRGAQ